MAENRVKILLPRITVLEEHFYSRPVDVAEQRRRDELTWYTMISLPRSVLIPS